MRRNAPDRPDTPDTHPICPAHPVHTGGADGAKAPASVTPDAAPDAVIQARALFPRGLVQPAGGFRFSVDALLLAAFAGQALTARGSLTASAAGIRHGRLTAVCAHAATEQGMSDKSGDAPANASGAASGGGSGDTAGGTSGGTPCGTLGMASGTFADLGTGCGVVGLALLLAHPHLTGTGIDIDGELADAARQNGGRLGLTDSFRVLRADLTATDLAAADMSTSDALPKAGSMDLVVANPPYRRHGSGRPSPNSQRTRALFETPETLPAFTRAAARLLRAGGRSCWVYGPDRLPDLLLALRETGQEPARLRCVHARAHGPATLVLVEARRAGKPGLVVEPPLILHSGEGAATALTDEALAFCPLLACNAGGRGR